MMTKRFHYILIKSALLVVAGIFVSFQAYCQYYYKDIVTTQQVNHTWLLYKTNKITSIKLNSFQGNIPVTEGFICEQKISVGQVSTYTKTADAGESFLIATYNAKALLVKTVDSSSETISTTQYEYDADDHIVRISNETHARDQSSRTVEVHSWLYNNAGKPAKMYRIRNNKDSVIISFATDEKNNVSEENVLKGAQPEKTYYYYDDQNRMTDIVRYNARARRLLPDYIFEYDDDGELATMMVVPEGGSDYLKWYYKYDEAGLKVVDFCYNKKKELQGKIEYNYNGAGK